MNNQSKNNIDIFYYIYISMTSPHKPAAFPELMSTNEEMYVTKRNGTREIVSFDKILNRIKVLGQVPAQKLGQQSTIKINYTNLVMKVIDQLYDGISTTKIDELSAEQCASMASIHPDYNVLAGRITMSNHHRGTSDSFVDVMTKLYQYTDKHNKPSPLVSDALYDCVANYGTELEAMINYENDYLIDYFGFKTLERAYLTKIDGKTVERPQHMWLRVSIGIHYEVGKNSNYTLNKIQETYQLMSLKYFTHATPTLFNSGTPHQQNSSCFLMAMESDSMDGIYNTLKDCAMISKWAGGIGLHIHNIRATGSLIRGTNGKSTGIVPMLRVFNNTAKYVDQGSRRNGSFAIYLEPWHADIEYFLQMRKNHGDEEMKARDLFYALWTPDLFMERVKADGQWTLMCPDECPGLADVYGDEFKRLYTEYEQLGKGRKTMKARDLWFQVLDAQMETGTPYLLYKDACNKKSNQKNLGTIKSSNLCVAPETMILTDQGHKEIQTLANTKVNVWNGKEFSEVDVVQTGKDQQLITVETDDGCQIECTPYHKFFIQNSYNKKSIKTVEAKDLKEGDKISKCEYPVIDGKEKMKYPYTHGFFCGDGTYSNVNDGQSPCKFKSLSGHYYCARHLDYETDEMVVQLTNPNNTKPNNRCNAMSYEKKALIYLYDDKKNLIDHFDYRSKTENNVSIRSPNTKDGIEIENSVKETTSRIVLQLPIDINEKFFVPMNNTLSDKMEWLSGYCDADGTIAKNGTNLQLQMSSINRTFLMNIKLMLQTCGVNAKLKCSRLAGLSYLPDGKGGHKYFDTQPVYRLLITSVDLQKLVDIGFSPRRLKIDITTPNRAASQFVKIKSVTNTGRIDDTYCFTEPKQHAGIFNGLLTSQCSEIVQYSDDKETAVCNLASIGLPTFIVTDPKTGEASFDYEHLHRVVKVVTYNLNRIIDVNFYPTEKTERSNKRHRPIGIGVQGLADVFMLLELPFSSEQAKTINKHIFETIYHAAVEQSCELAERDGPYETFAGSPAQRGQLQFDLWQVNHNNDRYDWLNLKDRIHKHGLRNSLLLAPMPTASTSQILGYNECIEPITSNIYNRRTIAGEFIMANKYLMNDLIKLDLWNERIKNSIIANHGSIQHIDIIPEGIRERYRTVWEIPMRNLIDMAADRGIYVCQSQSLNLWLEDPTYSNLTSMHFYSWTKGLKTGIYYLRRRARHQAQQFTIEPEKNESSEGQLYEEAEDEICEMCSA
jgi:ribonucleoside-diphosphate reductase alpha chain